MSQFDPTFDLKVNIGHSDHPVILPYILKTLMDEHPTFG